MFADREDPHERASARYQRKITCAIETGTRQEDTETKHR